MMPTIIAASLGRVLGFLRDTEFVPPGEYLFTIDPRMPEEVMILRGFEGIIDGLGDSAITAEPGGDSPDDSGGDIIIDAASATNRGSRTRGSSTDPG